MKKIFLFFMAVLSFLGFSVVKVHGMSIPNVSQVKLFNLVWRELGYGGSSDHFIYDLVVELEPGEYENINNIIISWSENLNLYGVLVFQYPRIADTLLDEKYIIYQENPNDIEYRFYNVDFIAAKKMSNRFELYISENGVNHSLDYYPGLSNLGGNRDKYYIPNYDTYENGYADGYDAGYGDGFQEGKKVADEFEYTRGYNFGWDEGYDYGYDKGILENLETGGFGLILKQVFIGIGSFLGIQLLPGISIGAIIAVPIVFGIIAFILGRRKE